MEAYYPLLIFILSTHIIIPFVLILFLAFKKNKCKFDLFTKSAFSLLYMFYFLTNGYWDIFLHLSKNLQAIYYLRFIIPALFLLVFLIKVFKVKKSPFYISKPVISQIFRGLLIIAILIVSTTNVLYLKSIYPLYFNVHKSIAFVDVNVITMENEEVLKNQTVLVKDGKIFDMGPSDKVMPEPEMLTIDGKNKYLIPGLMDLHTHPKRKEDILLYASQGITTIRNMDGTNWHLKMRQYINDKNVIGPRMYTSGPITFGAGDNYSSMKLVNASDADNLVKQQKEAGYDFIKVYGGVSLEVFNALGNASKKYGIKMAGHVPDSVNIYSLAQKGFYSIEHCVWNNLNDPYILKDAGIWYCPTIVAFAQRNSEEEVHKLLSQSFMKYVSPSSMQDWELDFKQLGYDLGDVTRSENGRNQLYSMYYGGVRVIAGTDSPIALLVPGYSLHQELREFVLTGLTPYEALKACTRDSAEFLGDLQNSGTIKKGKRADLILLNSNPLNTISNTNDQYGVVLNGSWYTSSDFKNVLDGMSQLYFIEEAIRDLYNLITGAVEQKREALFVSAATRH